MDVSTREHVADGPLSSGPREALHFVERPEITAALNLTSSLPPAFTVLFLSAVLSVPSSLWPCHPLFLPLSSFHSRPPHLASSSLALSSSELRVLEPVMHL